MKTIILILVAFLLGAFVFGTVLRIADAKAYADFRMQRSICQNALVQHAVAIRQNIPAPPVGCASTVYVQSTNKAPDAIIAFCRHAFREQIGANVLTADGQVHRHDINGFAKMMNDQGLFKYWENH